MSVRRVASAATQFGGEMTGSRAIVMRQTGDPDVLRYSTEDLNGLALRAATAELLAMRLPPPPTTVLPLADAARAHTLVESRAVRGRVVLVP
jgi:hypothetical protein